VTAEIPQISTFMFHCVLQSNLLQLFFFQTRSTFLSTITFLTLQG